MPTCTALAPSISAAATPRASAMPPVATTGTLHRVGDGRDQREEPDEVALGVGRIERAAMAARLHPLRDDHVGAGVLGGAGLGAVSWRSPTRRCRRAFIRATKAGG